ncbi:hypothetical protein ACYZUD_04245 [Pseudomonas sp. XS1P51]
MFLSKLKVIDPENGPYQYGHYAQINYKNIAIADIESQNNDTTEKMLSYNHFAVKRQYLGKNLGRLAILTFAKHISKNHPKVQTLKFDLYRQKEGDDPVKLREARIKMFTELGAKCTYKQIEGKRFDPPRWIVSVHWSKIHWSHAKTFRLGKRLAAKELNNKGTRTALFLRRIFTFKK